MQELSKKSEIFQNILEWLKAFKPTVNFMNKKFITKFQNTIISFQHSETFQNFLKDF